MQHISHLLDIFLMILPDKNEGDAFKSIDQREEELMDEIVVVVGAEVVDIGHQVDQDLAELILTVGANACSLQEVQEQFHSLITILHQYTACTLQ